MLDDPEGGSNGLLPQGPPHMLPLPKGHPGQKICSELSEQFGLYLSLIQGDLIQAQLDPGVSINAGLVQAREVVECPTCRWLVGELC